MVVIDLQKGITAMPAAHPIDEIISRSAQLASAFRKRGQPVVLVNVSGRAPEMPKFSTARSAYDLGYNVDAVTDRDAAWRRFFPKAEDVLGLLRA